MILHSHPATAPEPSATDLAEAYSASTIVLIVSFAETQPVIRAWRLDGERDCFRPVEVEIHIDQ